MSRYEAIGRKAGTIVAFGWDHPMLTFFLQVYAEDGRRGRRSGNPLIWLGGTPRELYDLDDLKRVAARHVELTPEMLAQLYSDRDEGR